MVKNITWDSKPIYDSWGATPDLWSGEDWLAWNIELRKHYKKEQADLIWCSAWLDGVSVIGGGTGKADGANAVFDSVPIDDRTFNESFRNYLSANGNELLYDAVFSGIGGEVGKLLSGTVATGENLGKAVKNVADTGVNFTKYAKYVIPLLLLILLGVLTYYGAKKIKTTLT